ncbi:hypothetical protein G8761_09215 [Bacillus sp. C11]|nr:hypothetical protein [Neobacillus terrae]
MAKWIVDTRHGAIKVSSEIGKGTIFTVRLPIFCKSINI